jgi:hypothetical protein
LAVLVGGEFDYYLPRFPGIAGSVADPMKAINVIHVERRPQTQVSVEDINGFVVCVLARGLGKAIETETVPSGVLFKVVTLGFQDLNASLQVLDDSVPFVDGSFQPLHLLQ